MLDDRLSDQQAVRTNSSIGCDAHKDAFPFLVAEGALVFDTLRRGETSARFLDTFFADGHAWALCQILCFASAEAADHHQFSGPRVFRAATAAPILSITHQALGISHHIDITHPFRTPRSTPSSSRPARTPSRVPTPMRSSRAPNCSRNLEDPSERDEGASKGAGALQIEETRKEWVQLPAS
jgi:hypothetical protein